MQKGPGSYSRPIVNIAILGIVLGVAVMILSATIVRGFRTEIRNKVVGFNAHLQITDLGSGNASDNLRVLRDAPFLSELSSVSGVKEIRPFITRACILESPEGIEGVISKGLVTGAGNTFIDDRIIEGGPLSYASKQRNEVLVSATTARTLDLGLGDKVSLYFMSGDEDFATRRMEVKGIYQTDLEEFDRQYVFIDQRHLQKINNWGLSVQVLTDDSCKGAGYRIEAMSYGGVEPHTLYWSSEHYGTGPYYVCPRDGKNLQIILSDDSGTVPDTATVHFTAIQDGSCPCPFALDSVTTSGGSANHYVGGFEVFLDDFDKLDATKNAIRKITGPKYYSADIVERTPEIFSWLEILDVNIYIIITLMIGVAIFNMSSALLIIIIERSNMIGVLKSLGADNWNVRQIFMLHAGKLILKGLLWGNVLGIGIALLQRYTGIIQLQAETYYLSRVPIRIDLMDIFLIDIGTLVICFLAMLIPSYFITRISPVEAIRFD